MLESNASSRWKVVMWLSHQYELHHTSLLSDSNHSPKRITSITVLSSSVRSIEINCLSTGHVYQQSEQPHLYMHSGQFFSNDHELQLKDHKRALLVLT